MDTKAARTSSSKGVILVKVPKIFKSDYLRQNYCSRSEINQSHTTSNIWPLLMVSQTAHLVYVWLNIYEIIAVGIQILSLWIPRFENLARPSLSPPFNLPDEHWFPIFMYSICFEWSLLESISKLREWIRNRCNFQSKFYFTPSFP